MMKRTTLILIFALLALVVWAQNAKPGARDSVAAQQAGAKAALDLITPERLLAHIKVLASDEYEGRAPGTHGEELAIQYIAGQFKQLGLAPGNPDGTYLQNVPLVGIKTDPTAELDIMTQKKGGMKLRFADDFVAFTERPVETVSLDADMVFVGYGVVAPEYQWDDFKDTDVRGKVLVFLINDPPLPDPKDPSKLDPKMFGGKAMTYYGRWTYKYEIAEQKGAAGALIIHETEPAAYPWDVVRGSYTPEQFTIDSRADTSYRLAARMWMTRDKAQELFAANGSSLQAMKQAALRRDFHPVPLNARAHLTLHNTVRHIASHNVVGKLEGSDPKLKDQYVIYTAHWDHLGIGLPNAQGDKIYNGAADNASGCAALIELGRAFKALPTPPRRSILFLSVTAEEKGLLGSRYYAENPLVPLDKTLADINMDVVNQWGRTHDVTVVGLGNSTLDDVLRQAAAEQHRVLRADPQPEKGFYYRSDHFNFAKQGVPALDPDAGVDYLGKPAGWGMQKRQEYTEHDYHKPSDEIKPDWDLSGAAEDARLYFMVGERVANAAKLPEWKPGVEFKAKRDAMMKSASSGQ